MHIKKMGFPVITASLLLLLSSCRMGSAHYMTRQQREQLEAAYDSLQNNYKALMAEYNLSQDTIPEGLRSIYAQMQQMHRQMDVNHRQMMSQDTGRHMMGGNGPMMQGEMGMQMQGHMTGEWYQQMMSMHQQMAAMHQRLGENKMAMMNRRLAGEFGKMMGMVPGLEKPIEIRPDTGKVSAAENGARLFTQNCSSCHGADAMGTTGIFPPLVNSEWVTGDKSIPIRIVLNGLSGSVNVNDQTYRGMMPAFEARLNESQLAAILNYLRSKSEGDLPEITRDDVIRTDKRYRDRTTPWTASELTQ